MTCVWSLELGHQWFNKIVFCQELMEYVYFHAKIVSLVIANLVSTKCLNLCSHCGLVLSLSASNVGTSMIAAFICAIKLSPIRLVEKC